MLEDVSSKTAAGPLYCQAPYYLQPQEGSRRDSSRSWGSKTWYLISAGVGQTEGMRTQQLQVGTSADIEFFQEVTV